jgi:ubiquinone biosynthesis protein COQ9
VRERILAEALKHVPFDGWSDKTLREASAATGADEADLRAAFPRGVSDALLFFSDWADRRMVEALKEADLAKLKVRERVALAVRTRIEGLMPHKEAARRAAAVLALPLNAADAAVAIYRTCDQTWRAVGDTSTDFNFYTKRALLAGVHASTMLYWFADASEGAKETWAFLDRRIGDVMQIEKLRAAAVKLGEALPNPLTILGALRYPKR